MGLMTLGDVWPGVERPPVKPSGAPATVPAPKLCPRTRKIMHPRKAEALAQLASLVRVSPDEILNTFVCPFCHAWHVGHI